MERQELKNIGICFDTFWEELYPTKTISKKFTTNQIKATMEMYLSNIQEGNSYISNTTLVKVLKMMDYQLSDDEKYCNISASSISKIEGDRIAGKYKR